MTEPTREDLTPRRLVAIADGTEMQDVQADGGAPCSSRPTAACSSCSPP